MIRLDMRLAIAPGFAAITFYLNGIGFLFGLKERRIKTSKEVVFCQFNVLL